MKKQITTACYLATAVLWAVDTARHLDSVSAALAAAFFALAYTHMRRGTHGPL